MTPIPRPVPHILNLVDVRRWDRQARLLTIVAAETWEGNNPVLLGTTRLSELLEEPYPQARWDLELLHRLETHNRVLIGGHRGGHAPLWLFAGDGATAVLRWRHVPWLVPRRAILQHLLGALHAVPVALPPQHPGRPPFFYSQHPPVGRLRVDPTRDSVPPEPPAAPREQSATPQTPQEIPGRSPVNEAATVGGAEVESDPGCRDTALLKGVKGFKDPVLPSFLKDGRTEGRTGRTTRQGQELLKTLEVATSLTFYGAPQDRLVALCEAHPAAEPALVAWVKNRDMSRYRVPSAVARVVVEHWERVGAPRAQAEAAAKCPKCKTVSPGSCFWDDCPRRSDG